MKLMEGSLLKDSSGEWWVCAGWRITSAGTREWWFVKMGEYKTISGPWTYKASKMKTIAQRFPEVEYNDENE